MNESGMASGGIADGHREQNDYLPEQFINRYVMVLTVLHMTVRGLGVLAFTWSTVVLLGGFVTLLRGKDFWFITLISFTQAARIFTAMADEQYLHLVKILSRPVVGIARTIWSLVPCRMNKQSPTTSRRSDEETDEEPHVCCGWFPSLSKNAATDKLIKIVLLIPLVLVVLHPVFVLFNIIASLLRLCRQDYGKEPNLKPAVTIFYSLALCQGVLFLLWFILDKAKEFPVRHVAKKYEFGEGWGTEYVRLYLKDTQKKCLKDLSASRGRNLVTYASGLMDSDYKGDYLAGARILVSFIEKQELPVEELIRSSRKRIQKLIMMLSWTEQDYQETRLLAAKIVAHVAEHISTAQFPGTLESVSTIFEPPKSIPALLHSRSMERRERDDAGHSHTIPGNPAGEDDAHSNLEYHLELVVQGLIILEKLTHDRNNCLQILKAEALLVDVLSWICSRPMVQGNEKPCWVNILKLSFAVLAQLTSLRVQPAAHLRRKICTELNPDWITGYASQPEIQMQAIEAFVQVFSADNSDSKKSDSQKRECFLRIIRKLFLSCQEMEQRGTSSLPSSLIQKTAGEALSELSVIRTNCDYILRLDSGIVLDELEKIVEWKDRIVYRAIAADILKRLYDILLNFPRGSQEKESSGHVERVLRKVLRLLSCSTRTDTKGFECVDEHRHVVGSAQSDNLHQRDEQRHVMRLQTALLRTIYDIHSKKKIAVIDFVRVVNDPSDFMKLLKELIVKYSRVDTAYHLEIVKWNASLIRSLIRRNGSWVQQIKEQQIMDSLSQASEIMSDADSWMLYGHNRERGAFLGTSLASIVQQIQDQLNKYEKSTVQSHEMVSE